MISKLKDQDFSTDSKRLASFDVDKLYPSLDPNLVQRSVKTLATEYYRSTRTRNWGALVELLASLLGIVMSAQIVVFFETVNGKCVKRRYRQVKGITTGLSCACQLANLHLIMLDILVIQSLSRHLFAYQRFIDDILVVFDVCISVDSILHLMNSFEDGILITHDSSEDPLCVHFLDLTIDIQNSHLRYATYRKPMNAYAYTPANSCHPQSVFDAVVATETCRIARTCSEIEDFNSQVMFFIRKLGLRGYSAEQCFKIASRQSGQPNKQSRLLVPFKFPYSPAVQSLRTSFFWSKHAHILPAEIRNGLRFIHCHQASPNLFRLRYNRFNDQSRLF